MANDDTTSPTESFDFDATTKQLTDLVVANPVPSVLAAAATGAALMALIALMARPRSFSMPDLPDFPDLPTSVPSSIKVPDVDVSSLKDQLADLAQRVASAFPSKSDAKQQIQDAQSSVQDTVQSTWNTVRDQASGVMDQVQPQLAAATKVARENPLWSALIVGALGTLLGAQLLGKSK